jgi:hypothetical protein
MTILTGIGGAILIISLAVLISVKEYREYRRSIKRINEQHKIRLAAIQLEYERETAIAECMIAELAALDRYNKNFIEGRRQTDEFIIGVYRVCIAEHKKRISDGY